MNDLATLAVIDDEVHVWVHPRQIRKYGEDRIKYAVAYDAWIRRGKEPKDVLLYASRKPKKDREAYIRSVTA